MSAFAIRLVSDKWAGVFCEEEEVELPTITLSGRDDAYLCIGGGRGRYVVYAWKADGTLWNLLSHKGRNGGKVMLNVGGQEGDYPMRQVVDMKAVQQAAEPSFKTGEMDSSLLWEQQSQQGRRLAGRSRAGYGWFGAEVRSGEAPLRTSCCSHYRAGATGSWLAAAGSAESGHP